MPSDNGYARNRPMPSDTARLPSSAIDGYTAEDHLQDMAETATRIEGEAQHLRAEIERLKRKMGVEQ